jgi:hypothetical protein
MPPLGQPTTLLPSEPRPADPTARDHKIIRVAVTSESPERFQEIIRLTNLDQANVQVARSAVKSMGVGGDICRREIACLD